MVKVIISLFRLKESNVNHSGIQGRKGRYTGRPDKETDGVNEIVHGGNIPVAMGNFCVFRKWDRTVS